MYYTVSFFSISRFQSLNFKKLKESYVILQFAWMEACLGSILTRVQVQGPKAGLFIFRYSYFWLI